MWKNIKFGLYIMNTFTHTAKHGVSLSAVTNYVEMMKIWGTFEIKGKRRINNNIKNSLLLAVTYGLYNNNNNNNNNNNKLQLGCHPVAVVILHVNKTWNWLLLDLSLEGYMRSM